jgi:hypothetical protein
MEADSNVGRSYRFNIEPITIRFCSEQTFSLALVTAAVARIDICGRLPGTDEFNPRGNRYMPKWLGICMINRANRYRKRSVTKT